MYSTVAKVRYLLHCTGVDAGPATASWFARPAAGPMVSGRYPRIQKVGSRDGTLHRQMTCPILWYVVDIYTYSRLRNTTDSVLNLGIGSPDLGPIGNLRRLR